MTHPGPGTSAIHKPAGTATLSHRRCRMPYLVQEGAAPGVLYGKVLDAASRPCPLTWSPPETTATWSWQAESLMMAKEHFIETYGTVRYTFPRRLRRSIVCQNETPRTQLIPASMTGCIVEASFPMPGRYWRTPRIAFPRQLLDGSDAMGSGGSLELGRSEASWENGEPHRPVCAAWAVAFKGLFTRRIETGHRYRQAMFTIRKPTPVDPRDVMGLSVAQLGRRPAKAWGPVEKTIGHGFANRPARHHRHPVRLKALMNGLITPRSSLTSTPSGGTTSTTTPSPNAPWPIPPH